VVENTFQILPRIGPCPECGHALRVVTDGEMANLLCPTCGACWHDELSWIHRVDPATCPGCSLRGVCRLAERPYGTRPTG